jgi:hypothetical protein
MGVFGWVYMGNGGFYIGNGGFGVFLHMKWVFFTLKLVFLHMKWGVYMFFINKFEKLASKHEIFKKKKKKKHCHCHSWS